MATIVKLKNSDRYGILVGVGYGMFKSSRPGMIFGNMDPHEKSGESEMAAISTAGGDILWCPSDDLTIVSIDGNAPSEHLSKYFTK